MVVSDYWLYPMRIDMHTEFVCMFAFFLTYVRMRFGTNIHLEQHTVQHWMQTLSCYSFKIGESVVIGNWLLYFRNWNLAVAGKIFACILDGNLRILLSCLCEYLNVWRQIDFVSYSRNYFVPQSHQYTPGNCVYVERAMTHPFMYVNHFFLLCMLCMHLSYLIQNVFHIPYELYPKHSHKQQSN